MTEKSRTEYSARNTSVAVISRILAIVMGYAARVVFTHTLSESYVGINGLFTDILNVLALSELGMGTAITYALYKPIAEKDIERQKSLMRLFQWLYRAVAMIVAVAGLCVIPFMGYLVKDANDVQNLILIYLLYLLNSVVSYLVVYKKILMDAHQLSYIGVLYHVVSMLLQYGFQIVVLLTTHNFILFLLIHLFCTIGYNILVSRKANSLYPYLRDKDIKPIPKEEKKGIVNNIKAMLMHKVGNVVVNNTDNLLISVMVGIISVGKYSNYYLIIGSIRQVLDQAFQGLTASVGNLGVTENRERVKKIFESIFFIGQWVYGFAAICLFHLLNFVVTISFGEKYLFTSAIVFMLCMNFFVTGMRQATLVFRDSLGLFWYDRYKSLVEAVINLIASILLTLRFGIIGVFLGTFISTMATSFWIEPFVLYRKRLKASMLSYFVRYAIYSALVFVAGYITNTVCNLVQGGTVKVIFLNLLICVAIPNLLFLICYHRTREFRFLLQKLKDLWNKRQEKRQPEEKLSASEEHLLDSLKGILTGEQTISRLNLSPEEWDEILGMADRHVVLSFLYDYLMEQELSEVQKQFVTQTARKTVLQSYHLLWCTHMVVEKLKERGITAVVLKGAATAENYPVPELRKSGDVDLLIPIEEQMPLARDVLLEHGFVVEEEQLAQHHLVMRSCEGIELELHSMLAEPFDNSEINNYLRDCLSDILPHIEQQNIMGYDLPVLSDGYHAFELLLHMLQHFLRSGFGLKLLCDWVVFWNRPVAEDETSLYCKLVEECGLTGFSRMITSVCVIYLGLQENSGLCSRIQLMEEADAISFIKDIFEAEEFGKSGKDRMVALRGTSLTDYVREFHHQMHLNFPKAGKVFLIWPVLWGITLCRFLYNNRRIRGVTAKEILNKAKKRSDRMEQLHLFKKERG